jgi:transposase
MPNTAPYDANFTVPERLYVDRLSFTRGLVTIYASITNLTAEWPLCKQLSRRIQGCYTRTLADLPWCGTPVRLRVRVRKFFCDVPSCERRVFAERLEDVARVCARGTDCQREALEWIAFALGGQAGARLAFQLGLIVSPDTLLNRIREAFRADEENVRVLSVDDFGLGRDNAPATILVTRHVVSLFLRVHQRVSRKIRQPILRGFRSAMRRLVQPTSSLKRFAAMIRDLDGGRLEEWLAQAESCEAPALRRFAASLKTDLAAVRAGLVESWNNGPVEGFIHKLKLVKRQGYGRANIDLLKARDMAA